MKLKQEIAIALLVKLLLMIGVWRLFFAAPIAVDIVGLW